MNALIVKKFLVLQRLSLLLIFVCGNSIASETWVNLAASQNGDYKSYLDTDSFEQMGAEKWAVWIKIKYASPKRDGLFKSTYVTDLRRYFVNCSSRTTATIQRILQDEDGKPVSQESWIESKWRHDQIGPKGGTNYIEFQGVCSLGKFPLRRLNFSPTGQWNNIVQGFGIDESASLLAMPWVFYRSISRDFEQRRVNDKKLTSTITYTIHNCEKRVFSVYALGQLGEENTVLSSFIVPTENLIYSPVIPNSASDFVQEKYCVNYETTKVSQEVNIADSSNGKSKEIPSSSMGLRRALVIGNDTYKTVAKLSNAREDARTIAANLTAVGYQVTLLLDLNEKEMKTALRTFASQVQGGDEVLFYFAGHGVQLGSANYLLPTDIVGDSEAQVKDEAIQLQRVLDDMSERKAKFTLAMIDACRDNPFKTTGRAIGGRGLAPTTAATGQMVIFSAGTGQQALDKLNNADKNKNGLFTRVFVQEMQKPSQSIDRVVKNVRNQVAELAKSVGHEQVPAIYDQVLGDFYFKK